MKTSFNLNLSEEFDQFIMKQIDELMKNDSLTLEEIVETPLQNIGESFDMDRISLFIREKTSLNYHRAHEWCNLGIEPSLQHTLAIDLDTSRVFDQLISEQQTISSENIDNEDMSDSGIDIFMDGHMKAFIALPIAIQKQTLGFLLIEHHRRPQTFDAFKLSSFHLFMKSLTYRLLPLIDHRQGENKTSDTSQLITNISHEVRTPLNALGNALYLIQTTDISKEQKSYLEMAQESMDHILKLVNKVLDLDRIEKGHLEFYSRSFDLEDEIVRMLNNFKVPLEKKKLKLMLDYDYNIKHQLIGDARKMRQILMQIIDNAIKFTEKGTISLTVRPTQQQTYLFEVKDTGIGISKEHITHLDEAFFQVDMSDQKKHEGLGLGLPLAYELIKFLKGSITIDSKLGEGTTVSVEIPLIKGQEITYDLQKPYAIMLYHEDQTGIMNMLKSMNLVCFDENTGDHRKADIILFASPLKVGETLTSVKERFGIDHVMTFALNVPGMKRIKKIDGMLDYPISRQIFTQKLNHAFHIEQQSQKAQYTKQLSGIALIVDDNRLNRLALERILNQLGIQSVMAESGAKAIQIVKKQHVDLILMDVQMPNMDGFEATRRIRSLGQRMATVPILVVTANAYFKDYDLLKTSKINDVIFKPIQVESLLQLLRKHLSTSHVIRIPDEIVAFDQRDFMERFEGSYTIAQEVILTFGEEYQKDLEMIRQAIHSRNPEQIIASTHYFKGSCSYVSAKRLVWLLNYMMEQAKLQKLDEMDEVYRILMEESKQLIEALDVMKTNQQ